LALYTAAGGVPPQYTLPVLIDAGTNNETLMSDPLYLGLKQTRIPDDELDDFVDEFVAAVEAVFPGALIQFEDWAGADAIRLLERYRERVCCFNDDVQGTAAVALAGILGALRITGTPLAQQRFLFLGAGSAAVGTADLLAKAIRDEGVPENDAQSRVALFDRKGLVTADRETLHDYQRPFAQRHAPIADFVAAIETLRPTGIIGLSTVGGAFDQRVIEAMSRVNERPMIFAYSNPTSRSECTAEQAYTWSAGRAVFAGGSPFVAARVAEVIFDRGLARVERPADILEFIRAQAYVPRYQSLV